jgi:putative SOS response-associated peptidase YedK
VGSRLDADQILQKDRFLSCTKYLESDWGGVKIGRRFTSGTMIITEPNTYVAEVHDRMPVILADKDFDPWLRGEAGLELLKPAPDDLLQRWPLSKRVNSSKAPVDDPTLIDKVAA